jgi:hypothetical protein
MSRPGFFAVLFSAALLLGCGDTATDTATPPKTTSGGQTAAGDGSTVAMNKVEYCHCGQEKGSDSCCKEGAEMCEKCGKATGSPLCCVDIPADMKDKDFCSCGWVKGSENCCSKDGVICEKCGMHEGSTLCCKIKK